MTGLSPNTITLSLALVTLTGCWHHQVPLPEALTLNAFVRLHAEEVRVGHRAHVGAGCIEQSYRFHREAAKLLGCRSDADCEVVIGNDPVGPVWLALSRGWREERAGVEYQLTAEKCGDVDNLGSKPAAICRSGECWLSKEPGRAIWSAR
jgi:hypothetical protein